MIIEKIKVENYKIFEKETITLNEGTNVFVGENDSGKSTILEILEIIATGKLKNFPITKQIKACLFNNKIRKDYITKIKKKEKVEALPYILIEAYCKKDELYSQYKGTNNSLGEDCPGIKLIIEFDSLCSERYMELLNNDEIYDIPIEFYNATFTYFSDDQTVDYKYSPFKVLTIDTTKKDYSNVVNKFITESITTNLTKNEQKELNVAYRKNKNSFRENQSIVNLNDRIKKISLLKDHVVCIDLEEQNLDNWKNELTILVDEIPFTNLGYGSQNIAKIELATNSKKEDVNIITIEEPENNLSYGNMAKLISKIETNNQKQIFISTHSSFVSNKLGLENIQLVYNGKVSKISNLDSDTIDYFKKLPGYDTLRLVLANEVILVEGPTDELIIQKAYYDLNNKLPIDDGIDVISIDSLAFKRYCNIAINIQKNIKVVTDNDGNIEENIKQKYADYQNSQYISFFYEADEKLVTIEPSILEVNFKSNEKFDNFREAISIGKNNDSMKNKSKDEVLKFINNNKSEWALRVFKSSNKIEYPEYIKNAIKK